MSLDTPTWYELTDEPRDGTEPGPNADVEHVLQLVRNNALHLLSGFSQPPSALRVRAGGVTVEIEWPVALAGPVVAAAGGTGSATDHLAAGVAQTVAPTPAATDDRRYLCAPMVGAFFRAAEPGTKPFVDVGDLVVAGQQVAIVEAMKLMIPVHAELDGQVVEVLKENGESVEYGERLFALAPL